MNEEDNERDRAAQEEEEEEEEEEEISGMGCSRSVLMYYHGHSRGVDAMPCDGRR